MQNANELNQENAMFDMRRTGALLSRLRRDAGLTQAELAEKLGISYQAVSSWERGASMPDIGKLVDLARALDTTVDYILSGEKPETPPEAPEAPQPEPAPTEAESASEAPESKKARHIHIDINGQDLRHGVRPTVIASGTKNKGRAGSLASLFALAPFLDQETLDQTALNAEEPFDLGMLCGLAPFLSTETLDQLAERCSVTSDTGIIGAIAPFLSQETVRRLFARCQKAAKQEKERESAVSETENVPGGVMLLIDRCDSDEIPELAEALGEGLDTQTLCALAERCDSDLIPDLAEVLAPQLDDEAIRTLIDCCDSDRIPELAEAIKDQLNEEHVERLFECCDSDMLIHLIKTLPAHLVKNAAGNLLRQPKE